MAIPDSALFLACNSVADFISNGIQANTHGIKIYLGSPADITKKDDEDRLNLFFYRMEPSGFQAGVHPQDPWRIRLFCMVTAMAEDGDAQGEGDLKLIGLIMALFHDQRILPSVNIYGQDVRLEAIFNPATDEQINQLWSTQGDTSYRPSILYEFSLTPILQPDTQKPEPPRVGAFGLETRADIGRRYDPFAGTVQEPQPRTGEVTITNPAWTPLIAWVDGSDIRTSLTLDVDSTTPASFNPTLWIAGDPGASVDLEWSVWEGDTWRTEAGPTLSVSSQVIDPESIPVALPTLTLPSLTVTPADERWQLLLHVTRQYTPHPGATPITLRSNPLLISLYRSSTP
ncbi:DUF4255 domain-containing protein [Saccharospirillum salsuginis]|uniref:Pvc16 N-terminal domain-containing protein n=1 Tax=Saccharospirillum salsuginis TaxID=418750 RepID=A0A918JZR1_9GAMM|nr:DUF4255 domain-containing protein [Saccharospirillum salsuginis]GGX39081.1 hypothetical protein GCM10007392_01730 [Saccharospirillum salsuginis]